MAHTNQTPNYGLSEFVGSDKPAWLIDYNGDMEKIDLGVKAAKDVADAAKAEADQGALDIAAVTITANSADAKASGAVSDLADAYDATSTYNVGDFVIYNNILYRCITAITVPESFDGTHWARTTVEEIITQINNDKADKLTKIVDITDGVARSWISIASTIRNALLNISRERAFNAIVVINGRHYDVTYFTSNTMYLTANYSFMTGVDNESSAFQIQLQYDNGTVLHEVFASKISGNTVTIDSSSAVTHTDSIEVWA